MRSDAQVVVVGAGPGGAALALLLASRGIETVLVERQSDFAREFRGEVMMPSGLAILEQLGVDARALPHRRPERFQVHLGRWRFLDLRVDPETLGACQPWIVSQPHLLEQLVERASKSSTFRFVRGGTVRELEHGGVRVRTAEGEEHLRARLVVGADGRASIVRRRGGFRVHDRGTPMDIVWCKLPLPEFLKIPTLRGYLGGGHLLIALPAPDGLLQIAWVILKGTYGELRSRGVEEWVRSMAEHVEDALAEHLRSHVEKLSRPFLLDSVTDRVKGWAKPGLLLIGDAAHTMSPVGGQGLNLALRDAVVAANHLVPALRNGGDVDAAAARVEPERSAEIEQIQALAAQPPRVILGNRVRHALMRRLVATLLSTDFGRSRAAPIADVFLNGVADVALRI